VSTDDLSTINTILKNIESSISLDGSLSNIYFDKEDLSLISDIERM
jgi:hypothetical protein